ncbi:MAG: DEAD/DEAH box helicase [Clostridia bacterium]|nr:DEAD/DEAH box helicase [Clostridia bacterium]MDD4049099.1 DEAD/DEAH box helicase [Clostridia bacterium]
MIREYLTEKVNMLLESNKPKELTTHWTINSVLNRLNDQSFNAEYPTIHSELLAFLYQSAGVKLDGIHANSSDLYKKSYDIWKVILSESIESGEVDLKQLFYLASNGLLADEFAEVRMILIESRLEDIYQSLENQGWPELLENSIYLLILILIRKLNGWEDIKLVDTLIYELQAVQQSKEEAYYAELSEDILFESLCWSAALFNVLEAIESYKKYILTGKPENIEKVILRFCRDSYELLGAIDNDGANFLFVLIEKVLIKLTSLSLWTCISGVSEKLDNYIEILTGEDNEKPIFELWPSQKQAIGKNLFDNTKTAIVVQMPTSAGKTLLAKFYILQTMNLFADSKVAYIVPTRALVNQVKKDLRSDFKSIGINVDISIPYADIEEMEDELLLKESDIIVTTPEKLDILMKVNHPIVKKLKLVVVDEAHGIQETNRGAKLELLLAMLRKDNRSLRILMLSPFIENAMDIANWLGADRGHDILVDWKPSQQFPGTYLLRTIERGKHQGEITYIPSALSTMYTEKFVVPIHSVTNKSISKTEKSVCVAKKYSNLGGVLILCTQKKYAENVVRQLMSEPDCDEATLKMLEPLLLLVSEELGEDSILYQAICKGFAYHHSALPLIVREEIEEAISNRLIKIVAATTTLAQGMNFPISTVIFQGMTMYDNGRCRDMKPSEFWNIAGRAGRALVDKEGHIISICCDENEVGKFEKYLSNKNQEVISSLIKVIEIIPEDQFSKYWIKEYNALSSLLQYIYHTILVSPDVEIDDLLRGSLVYYQLSDSGQRSNAEKLVRFTRNYLNRIKLDRKRPKLMESIDKTGLSSVSMHFLLAKISENNIAIDPSSIFNTDDNKLVDIIKVVNEIPEINLGLTGSGRFNPELVAVITKAWVDGKSIREIADKYIKEDSDIQTTDDKMSKCGEYIYGKLINNLPWGISAIQRLKGVDVDEGEVADVLVPSYIYFGVKSQEAVALSMLGVPRFAAEKISKKWKENHGTIDKLKLEELSQWLRNSSKSDWIDCFSKDDIAKGKLAYDIWKKNNG